MKPFLRRARGQCGRRMANAIACFLLVCVAAVPQSPDTSNMIHAASFTKPYQVLLVVDHSADPAGIVISKKTDAFQPVAALLQAWSVPYDILRLDQQHLDASYLFDRAGKPRYGTVLWLADADSYAQHDLASLEAAARAGTGIIAVDSRVRDPLLEELLGVHFAESYTSIDPIEVTTAHYITRNVAAVEDSPVQGHDYSERFWVHPTAAKVLMTQGSHPVLTVNSLTPNTYAIWLGVPTLAVLPESSFWRELLFRSLVWSEGYVVVPDVDYAHRVIFELDDWGTADKGFLSYWRYLEPQEDTIRHDLIEPLEHHHAVATAEVNTGYMDRKTQRVLSPWTQKFTDAYGLHQDYGSTYVGLKEAANAGVLDIESHGWTHMNDDLQASPGPWWTADLAGEGSMVGWYAEFQDQRRDRDVPAVTQIFHMERSLTELQQDFGRRPLELKPGNNSWSKSQFDNTAALAARVGFGLFHGDTATYYLDPDRALEMANVIPDFNTAFDLLSELRPERWPDHQDGPIILGFHDRDIAHDAGFMEKLFAALPPGYQTLGMNQYVGILHTRIHSEEDGTGLKLVFAQGTEYCSYFASHPSKWRLWLADPERERLIALHGKVGIDHKASLAQPAALSEDGVPIELPPGAGEHTWEIGKDK